MKKILLAAIIGAAPLGANAGDWGKAPVSEPKAPIEECYDLGGSITAGYMTDYIFRGTRWTRDLVFTNVAYTVDSVVPVTFNVLYANETATGPSMGVQDKLDLGASAALGNYGGFDVALGYTHYFFPEAGAALPSQGDINLRLSRSLGFADLTLGTDYLAAGSVSGGWYHHAGLSKTIGLTDAVRLVLGTGIGYNDNYFFLGQPNNFSGWAHYYATASLPIQLNCRTTLTPYIGFNGGIADSNGNVISDLLSPIASNGDVLHGGVSLAVSF